MKGWHAVRQGTWEQDLVLSLFTEAIATERLLFKPQAQEGIVSAHL